MFKTKRFLIVAVSIILTVSCFNARKVQTVSDQKEAAQTISDQQNKAQAVNESEEKTQTASNQQEKVQTIFDLEGDMQKEAVIPADVIAILKSDEAVDVCFQEKKGETINEADWFAASEIDLNGDDRKDLIIKPKDACLYGANQGPFWIFQNRTDGYLKILSANGLQLKVLPKKMNSFNKIEISKIVSMKPASEVYVFKKEKYQAAEKESRN